AASSIPERRNRCGGVYFTIRNCCVASSSPMTSAHPDILPIPRAESSPQSNGSQMAIQVLERAMRLLDVLATHSEPVPLKELAAATGLHTSTAHRILNDLVAGRYVDRV